MNSGIYKITSPSGKFYIGSSRNVEKRWREHRKDLRNGKHHNIALQRASNHYGLENLTFELIIECEPEQCLDVEQKCLDEMKPEYNIAKRAANPGGLWLGKKHREETKEKIRASHVGVDKSLRYNSEVRSKMSESAKMRAETEEGRTHLKNLNVGRVHSEEFREACSIRRRGEGSSTAILTEDKVRSIKTIVNGRRGEYGLIPKIAKEFGVKSVTIRKIVDGISWKHVII